MTTDDHLNIEKFPVIHLAEISSSDLQEQVALLWVKGYRPIGPIVSNRSDHDCGPFVSVTMTRDDWFPSGEDIPF